MNLSIESPYFVATFGSQSSADLPVLISDDDDGDGDEHPTTPDLPAEGPEIIVDPAGPSNDCLLGLLCLDVASEVGGATQLSLNLQKEGQPSGLHIGGLNLDLTKLGPSAPSAGSPDCLLNLICLGEDNAAATSSQTSAGEECLLDPVVCVEAQGQLEGSGLNTDLEIDVPILESGADVGVDLTDDGSDDGGITLNLLGLNINLGLGGN